MFEWSMWGLIGLFLIPPALFSWCLMFYSISLLINDSF